MRVAVLSDIHSNIVALDAVLLHAADVDAIWHLGDVVGYGPEPDAVVARLSEREATGVRGNHDAAAIGGPEIDWFNPEARAAAEWTRDTMSSASRAWLADLPERLMIGDMTLVHGSPRDPLREYITDSEVAAANLGVLQTTHGLHGHTHVPVAWSATPDGVTLVQARDTTALELGTSRTLLNPGSVGQPRDGDPRAAYLVLDLEVGRVTWHRVVYDIEPVQAGIRAAGLPVRLAARLAIGA
ncbi:MAG TPA: metallophosphoesterase family protein [Candidatus Limnocylindrales bacterium]|nr:metallophosphoesterase family protein [Candidatus Limnocylindrales bacterium]